MELWRLETEWSRLHECQQGTPAWIRRIFFASFSHEGERQKQTYRTNQVEPEAPADFHTLESASDSGPKGIFILPLAERRERPSNE